MPLPLSLCHHLDRPNAGCGPKAMERQSTPEPPPFFGGRFSLAAPRTGGTEDASDRDGVDSGCTTPPWAEELCSLGLLGNAQEKVVQGVATALVNSRQTTPPRARKEISPARVVFKSTQPAYVHVSGDELCGKNDSAPDAWPPRTHLSPPPRHPAQRPERPRHAASQTSSPPLQPPLPPPPSGKDNDAQGSGWPSLGSVGHPNACAMGCKYHSKAKGCKDGFFCTCCHLCTWRRHQVKREQNVDPMYLAFLENTARNNGTCAESGPHVLDL
jgi:hypothetical protein